MTCRGTTRAVLGMAIGAMLLLATCAHKGKEKCPDEDASPPGDPNEHWHWQDISEQQGEASGRQRPGAAAVCLSPATATADSTLVELFSIVSLLPPHEDFTEAGEPWRAVLRAVGLAAFEEEMAELGVHCLYDLFDRDIDGQLRNINMYRDRMRRAGFLVSYPQHDTIEVVWSPQHAARQDSSEQQGEASGRQRPAEDFFERGDRWRDVLRAVGLIECEEGLQHLGVYCLNDLFDVELARRLFSHLMLPEERLHREQQNLAATAAAREKLDVLLRALFEYRDRLQLEVWCSQASEAFPPRNQDSNGSSSVMADDDVDSAPPPPAGPAPVHLPVVVWQPPQPLWLRHLPATPAPAGGAAGGAFIPTSPMTVSQFNELALRQMNEAYVLAGGTPSTSEMSTEWDDLHNLAVVTNATTAVLPTPPAAGGAAGGAAGAAPPPRWRLASVAAASRAATGTSTLADLLREHGFSFDSAFLAAVEACAENLGLSVLDAAFRIERNNIDLDYAMAVGEREKANLGIVTRERKRKADLALMNATTQYRLRIASLETREAASRLQREQLRKRLEA